MKDRPVTASWTHRSEFALARTLETLAARLPERAADRLGARVGRLVGSVARIRRPLVEANLRLAFPEANPDWIAATADAAYAHLGREAVAMLRLSKLDRRAVIARTVPHGWEQLEEALALGRGVILVTGHYGNWELAAATVAARGVPIGAIVRRQGNRLVDQRLNALRHRLGVETIYQSEAPRAVPRLLRRNGVVGIVGDQDARRSGVFVPFFGRPASTHRGPALFALRLDAPVFSCVARRRPGELVYDVMGERVPVERSSDLEADLLALTARLAASLEAQIRVAPEQYFWFHRRWKTPPPPERASTREGIAPKRDRHERDDSGDETA